ncbi:MAG: hypothetical protein DRP64_20955, partial [Verrucomicrobia bacterium]
DGADQRHIKEWNIIRCFQSERLFKISAGMRSRQTKRTVGQSKFDFSGFNIDLSGGSQGTQYTYYYTITLENRSNVTLKNMTIEYHIYYRQQKNKSVKCGKIWIHQMDPKSKKREETTEGIPDYIGDIFYYQEVKVDGIWIRVTLPLSGDRKVVRE